MDQGDDSIEAIGRDLRQMRMTRQGREGKPGMAQVALAKRLDVDPSEIVRAEKGQRLAERLASRYDAFYDTGGVVSARLRTLTQARKRRRKVSPAYRRGFLVVTTAPVAASVLDQADKISRLLTVSYPDMLTLDELAEDSVAIAANYYSTPLDQLLPEVVTRWRQCADMIEHRPVGAAGQRVLEVGGQYAFCMARIGCHTGNHPVATGFGRLAARLANVSGDPLLTGSVACMRSWRAFERAQYGEAADVAGQAAGGQAHPYTRARLFAYQACALAAGGHPDQAREALADMRKNMVDLPPMPGAGLFDEGEQLLYSAQALADIGGRGAEVFARQVIEGVPIANDYQAHGLAWVTVGKALAGRDPGAAADAGLRALEVNQSWPSMSVEARTRRLHRDLSRRHGDVAEVVQLGEACRALRPAVNT